MVKTANLGFSRIGNRKELKKALEDYWAGIIKEKELHEITRKIKVDNWKLQKKAGVDYIPSNDFSLFDHVLDHIVMFGASPERYEYKNLDSYFAMAQGIQTKTKDIKPMEMAKWFDTNYYYIVPEFKKNQKFKLSSTKIIDEYKEAKEIGIETRPVILGPVSFLLLGKFHSDNEEDEIKKEDVLNLLPNLLLTYKGIFEGLKKEGVRDVQIDEPMLISDLPNRVYQDLQETYRQIRVFAKDIKIHLTTYFGEFEDSINTIFSLPVDVIHLDLTMGNNDIDLILDRAGDKYDFSLGIVDGRNIWANNIKKSLKKVEKFIKILGKDRVIIAPSCSLMHVPIDIELEENMNKVLQSWMAFGVQKLSEINIIKEISNGKQRKVQKLLDENTKANLSRKRSRAIHNAEVKDRVNKIKPEMMERRSKYKTRARMQEKLIRIPILPITTIGSFPQTKEISQTRTDFKNEKIDVKKYAKYIRAKIKETILFQEEIGLDILTHGEYERGDMVEYFGEKLKGFVCTKYGWIQSYGSKCVRPPIIYGDVYRAKPITTKWIGFAQSLSKKFVKGILTGPTTLLQWSFVRDDQPRDITVKQIALAIRDEISDLEKEEIKIIQIDEPALKDGIPIRKKHQKAYLKSAVNNFKLATGVADDKTQIHTYICYSDAVDMRKSIVDMDSDVLFIEAVRTKTDILNTFIKSKYPNAIGLGIYDPRSARIPSVNEVKESIKEIMQIFSKSQIWINPDCGLKTRTWSEMRESLISVVKATKDIR